LRAQRWSPQRRAAESGVLADNPRALSAYYDILLKHSFGNFREMLEAVTLSPAMGIYLDMRRNDKGNPSTGTHPNENYARELMELFTLGAGNYSEADVKAAARAFTAIACDADGTVTNPLVTLNGVTVAGTTFAPVTQAGCHSAIQATVSLLAQPGADTLVISTTDGVHTTSVASHFRYDESWEVTPLITTPITSEALAGGQQWADTFYVRNPGPISKTYTIVPACGGSTGCTASQTSVAVSAGQTAKVWVSYTSPTNQASAWVSLYANFTGTSGRAVSVFGPVVNVTLDQIAPTVTFSTPPDGTTSSVFPDIVVSWCDADGALVGHAVAIDGVTLDSQFTAGTQSGCASAGTSTWYSVAMTPGTHTITATATDAAGHVTPSVRTFTLSLPPVADFILSPHPPKAVSRQCCS
jgi:hypothetical protein